jgi:hypothetical protein
MKLSDASLALMENEYSRAVRKHGPTFTTLNEGLDAMFAEFGEVLIAANKNDIYGLHGIRREVAQVIAVGLKVLETIRGMEK